MPTGLVLRSTGSRYLVRSADGLQHECVAKGKLRTKGWKSTNPIAVGDHVEYEPQLSAELPGAITDVLDRKNYLVRRSVNLSHHRHVIAANLDRMLLIATVARPRTSFGFIDRFLVSAGCPARLITRRARYLLAVWNGIGSITVTGSRSTQASMSRSRACSLTRRRPAAY